MKGQHNQIVRMAAINGSIASVTKRKLPMAFGLRLVRHFFLSFFLSKENWLVWANLSACWHAGTCSQLQSPGPALLDHHIGIHQCHNG
jgi:hypothetical protein